VGETNLGLLPVAAEVRPSESCVPVLEFSDDEIEARICRAKELGAIAVVEGTKHPDYPKVAAVLADPWGYRFELTSFHD
jgi:predicted enzyme related to lactoylglutathione lyase